VIIYEPAAGSVCVLRDLPVAVRDGTVLAGERRRARRRRPVPSAASAHRFHTITMLSEAAGAAVRVAGYLRDRLS
jgi:hypothetical protein